MSDATDQLTTLAFLRALAADDSSVGEAIWNMTPTEELFAGVTGVCLYALDVLGAEVGLSPVELIEQWQRAAVEAAAEGRI